jgi:hypothetical protein
LRKSGFRAVEGLKGLACRQFKRSPRESVQPIKDWSLRANRQTQSGFARIGTSVN